MTREISESNNPFKTPDARDFFIATLKQLKISEEQPTTLTVFTRQEKLISYEKFLSEFSRQDFFENDMFGGDDQGVLNWYLLFTLYILRTNFALTEYDLIPLLLTTIQISAKSYFDYHVNNADYAATLRMGLKDLNRMESAFLIASDFRVYIYPETFEFVKRTFEKFKQDPGAFSGQKFNDFWDQLSLESRRYLPNPSTKNPSLKPADEDLYPKSVIPRTAGLFKSTVIHDRLTDFPNEPSRKAFFESFRSP